MYSLVSVAGVSGVAIALAARSTLENFLGTLNIFADHSVRVGDLCRYGEYSNDFQRIGTIEVIGLRSTSNRGHDKTITTIPSVEFSNIQIVNLTSRNLMHLRKSLAFVVDTADWSEFLAVQEDIIMRILKIVDEAGTALALPSQTLYLSRDPGVNSRNNRQLLNSSKI